MATNELNETPENAKVIEKIVGEKLTGIAGKINTHLHAVNSKLANIISQLTRGDRAWLTPERAAGLHRKLDETQALIASIRMQLGGRPSIPPSAG